MLCAILQNSSLQNLLQPVLPAATKTTPPVMPPTVLETAMKNAVELAAKELEQARKTNQEEISRAESNIATLQIPDDLLALGLSHNDLIAALRNTNPGTGSPGSTAAAALRSNSISRETLVEIAKAKGLTVK